MSEISVFLGPSLSLEHARSVLPASYFGPAALGDIARAARRGPFAIGLIDGLFEGVPAVWHKEILWALAAGVRVFGGASMGALRAAELSSFGMCGVGSIYRRLIDGVLEDDDEVAVAHASAEQGYTPLSEAMVSMRDTLGSALEHGVLRADECRTLVQLAKRLFYPDRSYPRLFRDARAHGFTPARLAALAVFVETRRLDTKRADALAVLRRIQAAADAREPAPEVHYALAHTDAWDQLLRWVDAQPDLTEAARR